MNNNLNCIVKLLYRIMIFLFYEQSQNDNISEFRKKLNDNLNL